ncbi:hypothetical protein ACFLTL_00590 [Chloroflexota bacterium]
MENDIKVICKEGVPAVALGFADQINFARNTGLIDGVPNFRWVDVPRAGSPEERVASFIDAIPAALIDPLTDQEKEAGLYSPPPPPRIIFEGTLDDAQEFFQKTMPISNCGNCPIATMTDGLPIIIPTEEKVSEMMTGTSHPAEETVALQLATSATRATSQAGSPITYAGAYSTTVEKVAVVAVMAGCKPEYLPAVLAVATSRGASTSCPGTSGASSNCFVVNGPFAKEVGMNARQQAFDVGNPPNMTISRSAALMTVNFGQCITGLVRTDSGNPFGCWTFAEDEEALPPGWETRGEEAYYYVDGERVYYTRDESVITKVGIHEGATVQEYAPSSFRGLISDGYGGMARRMGVEGVPGPHNFLEYVMPIYINASPNGLLSSRVLIMHPNMAKSLYDYGFKTKMAVYEWIAETYTVSAELVRNSGWYDFGRSGGERTHSDTGLTWNDLAAQQPDYQVQAFGTSVTSNCIIVAIDNADEMCWTLFGSRGSTYPIDPWR